MNSLKLAASSLLTALLVSISFAQEEQVSVRTLQLSGSTLPDSWVSVADAKEPVKLTWLTSQPTQPLQVLHDGSLKLLRYSNDPKGKRIVEIITSLKLPKSIKEVLLLAWVSNGDVKYKLIKDQFLDAKFDDWIAINTSMHSVALLAGESSKPIRINAGKSLLFKPKINVGKGVKMLGKRAYNGKVETFLSTYWPAFAKQRSMIIFYADGERIRTKRIGDRFLVKKKNKGL
jgi:hypothetical protein